MKVFEFNIDNTIDIITNSSSELFVLKGRTKDIVKEMIHHVYPEFESEYKLVSLQECDDDELSHYIGNVMEGGDDFSLCKRLNVRPNVLYKNFGSYGISNYWYGEYTEQGKKLLLESLPKSCYLLFSHDENPNWEMQERLMEIASRYHLG